MKLVVYLNRLGKGRARILSCRGSRRNSLKAKIPQTRHYHHISVAKKFCCRSFLGVDIVGELSVMAADGDSTVIQTWTQTSPETKPKPWAPVQSQTDDPQTESKLMKKMELDLVNLESSNFYRTLIAQIQTPQLISRFSRALSSYQPTAQKMQMVIYGIGSIEAYEHSRQQLSLAILLARQFDWIGGIEIFDPIITEMESRVMEALGCTVLMINEEGRREAKKPTFFFMPHCEAVLYDNLLEANWRAEQLNRIVVFGNSFKHYEQDVSEHKWEELVKSSRYILQACRFCEEVGIEAVSGDFFRAFHNTRWHFFNLEQHILD